MPEQREANLGEDGEIKEMPSSHEKKKKLICKRNHNNNCNASNGLNQVVGCTVHCAQPCCGAVFSTIAGVAGATSYRGGGQGLGHAQVFGQ